jgi:hypothetical protein
MSETKLAENPRTHEHSHLEESFRALLYSPTGQLLEFWYHCDDLLIQRVQLFFFFAKSKCE